MRRKGGGFFQGWLPWLLFLAAVSALVIAYAIKNVSQIDVNEDFGGGEYTADPTSSILYSQAQPRVTEDQIVAYVRNNAGDRLKNSGHIFYKYGAMYNIDPAFGVAVSLKETTLGKDTCQGISQSCNNFFCMMYEAAEPTGLTNGKCTGTDRDWASFESIEKGIEAFYKYIKDQYVDSEYDQETIADIGCAPETGRREHCYCWDNERDTYCQTWVGGSGSVPAFVSEIRNYNLLSSVTSPNQA
jgi:hypothetical protein